MPHVSFPIGVVWNQASNDFRDIQWRMWRHGWHDLKRPINKDQGHSFWYQSISHMWLPIGCNSNFAVGRTVLPQYIRHRQTTTTDDRRNTGSMSATVLSAIGKNHVFLRVTRPTSEKVQDAIAII